MKLLAKNILFGIAWGCTWLVFMGVLLFFSCHSGFDSLMRQYPAQALGASLIGIACVVPTAVYSARRLPPIVRFLIHIGTALTVYFPVAYALHWIPYQPQQPTIMISEIFIGIGIFLAIWYIFFLINRKEAQKINKRMQELKQNTSKTDSCSGGQ